MERHFSRNSIADHISNKHRWAFGEIGHLIAKLTAEHQCPGTTVPHDVRDLGSLKASTDRHHHGAKPDGAKQGKGEFGRVAEKEGDTIAFGNSRCRQISG